MSIPHAGRVREDHEVLEEIALTAERGECIRIMREMKERIRRIDQRLEEIESDDDPVASASARRQRRQASLTQKKQLCAARRIPIKLMNKAWAAVPPEIPEQEYLHDAHPIVAR